MADPISSTTLDKAAQNIDAIDKWANGSSSTTTTFPDGGQVDSPAKVVAAAELAMDGSVYKAETAATNAQTSETNAAASAAAASADAAVLAAIPATGVTGATTSTPSTVPIADLNGQIDGAFLPDEVAQLQEMFGYSDVVDIKIVELGDWVDRVDCSYQREHVPSGRYVGAFQSAEDAIAAGAGIGDWFADEINGTSTISGYYEILTLSPTVLPIYRAGSANLPRRIAIILPPTGNFYIHDLTKAGFPMWKVFYNGGSWPSTVKAVGNGTYIDIHWTDTRLLLASVGVFILDFAEDHAIRYLSGGAWKFNGNLAEANDGLGWTQIEAGAEYQLPNQTVNALATYTAPDAPLNSVGEPIRVLGIATAASSVSVMLEDGTINDSVGTTGATSMDFTDSGLLVWAVNGSSSPSRSSDTWRSDNFSLKDCLMQTPSGSNAIKANTNGFTGLVSMGSDLAYAINGTSGDIDSGIQLYRPNQNALGDSITAIISNDNDSGFSYNTGWFNSGCAIMCDNQTGNITGNNVETADWSVDVDGYAHHVGGYGTVVQSGTLITSTSNGTGRPFAGKSFATVVGETYVFSVSLGNIVSIGPAVHTAQIRAGNTAGSSSYFSSSSHAANDTHTFQITATDTSLWVGVGMEGYGNGATLEMTALTIDLATKDYTRSGFGAVVNGTLSRTQSGDNNAIEWSGFSASNYLELPATPLDSVGTGDFWVRVVARENNADRANTFFQRKGAAADQVTVRYKDSSGVAQIYVGPTSVTVSGSKGLFDNQRHIIDLVRKSGVAYLFVDGVLEGSIASPDDITFTTPQTFIGADIALANTAYQAYLGGVVIAPFAPSAQQIKFMAEQELRKYDDDAIAFLPNDQVNDMAYNEAKGVLKIATDGEVFDWKGLRGISSNVTGVPNIVDNSLWESVHANLTESPDGNFEVNTTGTGVGATMPYEQMDNAGIVDGDAVLISVLVEEPPTVGTIRIGQGILTSAGGSIGVATATSKKGQRAYAIGYRYGTTTDIWFYVEGTVQVGCKYSDLRIQKISNAAPFTSISSIGESTVIGGDNGADLVDGPRNVRAETVDSSRASRTRSFIGGNLVTNGDASFGITTPWQATTATLSIVSGRLDVANNGGTGYARQQIKVNAGDEYTLSVTGTNGASAGMYSAGAGTDFTNLVAQNAISNATETADFVATEGTVTVSLQVDNGSGTNNTQFDDVSVKPKNDIIWLEKGWYPEHVVDDETGIPFNREVTVGGVQVNRDWTVEFDGFRYGVKMLASYDRVRIEAKEVK